ncbi:MAG TPA: hypothetical protein VG272_11450 [Candidatus Acidoferrales bacterium]|jgi:hypothetical protein|nr:hypothetical protein [Candidatus Acidoferrales bacterium]
MVSKAASIPNYKVVEERKRRELEVCVAALKSSDVWRQFEALYRNLYASAELAGVRKPPLEELLGLGEPEKGTCALEQKEVSHLTSEDQQETEIAAELEKGS